MSYSKLIKNNVKMAFNVIGDLGEDIVFTNKRGCLLQHPL